MRLADRCHIDLPAAATRKFQLNAEKYPPPPPATPGHDRESSGSECKDAGSTAEEATLRLSCDHRGSILVIDIKASTCIGDVCDCSFFCRCRCSSKGGWIQFQV